MNEAEASPGWRRAAPLATIVLVVAALYLAQDLFLPFALAALFTFLLAPVVSALMRLKLPRSVAVVITVTAASGAVVGLGATVVSQLEELSDSLPKYRDTIRAKLSELGGAVASIEKGLDEAMPDSAPDAAKAPAEPLTVKVVPNRPSPFQTLTNIAGPVLGPLGTAAVVFVLVLFMLIYLEDLRDRVVRILAGRDVTVTTQAMTEVSRRISRYLFMTLVVNATYGIPVGIGLALLGLPNAFLWGLLTTVLRFIPYVGPWLGAAMPIALSFAISPGWGLTMAVIGMFLVLELFSNYVMEPWLYGSRTGLSPLAVIVCAIFWTWLWGTVGLLLSVPLTLIVVVSGRYIPALRSLHTLFGDEPGLGPEARFYQRLVARDPDEAGRIAEEFLDRRPLPDLYDAVVVPALRTLKYDESHLRLKPDQVEAMRAHIADLVEDLPAIADKKAKKRQKLAESERPDPEKVNGLERIEATVEPTETAKVPEGRVVFVPADDHTDALVGSMLADALRPDGIAVEVVPPTTLSNELVAAGIAKAPDAIVVAGFPTGSLARLRHLVGRFSEQTPTRVLAAVWDAPVDEVCVGEQATPQKLVRFGRRVAAPTVLSQVRQRETSPTNPRAASTLTEVGAHEVVHTLAECAEAVRRALRHRAMGIAS